MIRIQAASFAQFMAAFGVLRRAETDVTASGGNELAVPGNTDVAVLRAVAATGAVVHADLGEQDSEAAPEPDAAEPPETSARKPRKTTRRTSKE